MIIILLKKFAKISECGDFNQSTCQDYLKLNPNNIAIVHENVFITYEELNIKSIKTSN